MVTWNLHTDCNTVRYSLGHAHFMTYYFEIITKDISKTFLLSAQFLSNVQEMSLFYKLACTLVVSDAVSCLGV